MYTIKNSYFIFNVLQLGVTVYLSHFLVVLNPKVGNYHLGNKKQDPGQK